MNATDVLGGYAPADEISLARLRRVLTANFADTSLIDAHLALLDRRGVTYATHTADHLLPFSVEVAVGYLTAGRVLGLSKFARIVADHAHRLQLQVRLTDDVAATVANVTGSPDVAVLTSGHHLCMGMRGIRARAVMTTSALLGRFEQEPSIRAEFLDLVRSAPTA